MFKHDKCCPAELLFTCVRMCACVLFHGRGRLIVSYKDTLVPSAYVLPCFMSRSFTFIYTHVTLPVTTTQHVQPWSGYNQGFPLFQLGMFPARASLCICFTDFPFLRLEPILAPHLPAWPHFFTLISYFSSQICLFIQTKLRKQTPVRINMDFFFPL